MGIIGAEIGQIQNMTLELAKRNTQVGKAINKDVLMANLDIIIEFKIESHKRIVELYDELENKEISEIVKRKGNKDKLEL